MPVCAVVKNWRSPAARGDRAAERERSWLQNSYDSYKDRRFADCVTQSEQVLKLNPRSAAAYNNICAASNELGDFTHAGGGPRQLHECHAKSAVPR